MSSLFRTTGLVAAMALTAASLLVGTAPVEAATKAPKTLASDVAPKPKKLSHKHKGLSSKHHKHTTLSSKHGKHAALSSKKGHKSTLSSKKHKTSSLHTGKHHVTPTAAPVKAVDSTPVSAPVSAPVTTPIDPSNIPAK